MLKECAPHPLLNHLVSSYRIVSYGDAPIFQEPWTVSPTGHNTLTILLAPANVLDIGRNENMNARIRYSGQLDAVRYFMSDVRLNSAIFVNLKPGAGYELLGIPQQDFTNRWYELDSFLSNCKDFYNQLDDCFPDINRVVSVVDNWLLGLIIHSRFKVRPEVNFALQLIKDNHGLMDIVQLRNNVGMTRASFQNHFKEQVGISPKTYSRIVRINAVYGLLNQSDEKDYQQLVHDFHYFDQAHFIKDFKHFFGEVPSKFTNCSKPENDFRQFLK